MVGSSGNRTLIRLGRASLTALFLLSISSCVSDGGNAPSGSIECPQPRFTGKAPEPIYSSANPLQLDSSNLRAGRKIYEETAQPKCSICHGIKGDGRGSLASQFDPRPRNFACAATVNGIPDGQLFWIIQNGSPGTRMPAFDSLPDEQVWQLVLHLRSLARPN